MKLVRYGTRAHERPGLLDSEGSIRDLSGHVEDINGRHLSPDTLTTLANLDVFDLPRIEEDVRLGPCVAAPGKFVAIGLNYSDHALETGLPIPEEPVVFFKTDTCVSGPNDDIVQPLDSTKLDWEIEIAFVIGQRALYVEEAEAENYIAGYCIVNDV
ncbi:MAG: fumarylacetoacetate hydrolase family protein, partial [bacterium]